MAFTKWNTEANPTQAKQQAGASAFAHPLLPLSRGHFEWLCSVPRRTMTMHTTTVLTAV